MSFAPVYNEHSRALILGTWHCYDIVREGIDKGVGLADLCETVGLTLADAVSAGDSANDVGMEDIEAKKQIILRHGLALWDTLESCTITGASDASIRDVVPNDIAGLLAKAPIEAVFCNGATAYKIYTKYLEPVSGIPAVRLPSTSPANAACRPEKLREIWQKELSNWILP